MNWTPSACVSNGWGEGVRPSPEAGREQKNMVTAYLAVDVSARCEAEGEGRERTNRAGAVCCPASGSLERLSQQQIWPLEGLQI